MKIMLASPTPTGPLRRSALIGFLIVLPFLMLEGGNRRPFNEEFPIALFGFLWLLSTVFMVILMPIVRTLRTGNNVMTNPIGLLLRVVGLVIIGWAWGSLVRDQFACFLGVPNCD